MKIIKSIGILAVVCFSTSSFAYNAGSVESSCKLPKFASLIPEVRQKGDPVPEVDAESDIEFTVSGYADHTSIVAVAKNEPLELRVINKSSFHHVTATLPASLNGKYARINIKAVSTKTKNGDCTGKGGFLVKIREAAKSGEAVETNKADVAQPEDKSVATSSADD